MFHENRIKNVDFLLMPNFWKLALIKKSTLFVLSLWNSVKMINSWCDFFHQVSWGLNKKCGFFTKGQFLNVCRFLFPRLYEMNLSNAICEWSHTRVNNSSSYLWDWDHHAPHLFPLQPLGLQFNIDQNFTVHK